MTQRQAPTRTSQLSIVLVSFYASIVCTAVAFAQTDLAHPPLPAGAHVRLGRNLLRHADPPRCAVFTHDNKTLIVGAEQHLYFWDIETARLDRVIELKDTRAQCVILSADGKSLAAGGIGFGEDFSTGFSVELYDFASGELKAAILHNSAPRIRTSDEPQLRNPEIDRINQIPLTMALSLDGTRLFTSGKPARAWDIEERRGREMHGFTEITDRESEEQELNSRLIVAGMAGEDISELYRRLHLLGRSTSIALSPDGLTLATGDTDGWVRLWNPVSGELIRRIPACTEDELNRPDRNEDEPIEGPAVFTLAWSPDGTQLATVGGDNIVRIWDPNTRHKVREFVKQNNPIHFVTYTPDGKELLARSENHLYTWNLDLGDDQEPRRVSPGYCASLQFSVAVSPDGQYIAAPLARTTRVIGLLNRRTQGRLHHPVEVHDGLISTPVFTPDGRYALTLSNTIIRKWDVRTGELVHRYPDNARAGSKHLISTREGTQIVTYGQYTRSLLFWNLESGRHTSEITYNHRETRDVATSHDGRYAAIAGTDFQVGVYSIESGAALADFHTHQSGLGESVDFTPDGRKLIFNEKHMIHVGDLETGRQRTVAADEETDYAEICVMPDGRTVMANTYDKLLFLSIADGSLLETFEVKRRCSAAILTDDGRYIMTAPHSRRDPTRLWETISGQVVYTIEGCRGRSISPDNRWIASRGDDALLWSLDPWATSDAPPPGSDRLTELWNDLADEEAPNAYRTSWAMIRLGDPAVSFIENGLSTATSDDASFDRARIARLIDELDAPRFRTRIDAFKTLAEMTPSIDPALENALKNAKTIDRKESLKKLLDGGRSPVVPPDQRRPLRAIMVLERIATPEARRVLEKLANGHPGHRLTAHAQTALTRLETHD